MTDAYNFEFVATLPPGAHLGGRRRNPMHEALALALRERPGNWAKYPREFETSNLASATRSNIISGRLKDFPKGEFEAVCTQATLYVRFLGGGGAS